MYSRVCRNKTGNCCSSVFFFVGQCNFLTLFQHSFQVKGGLFRASRSYRSTSTAAGQSLLAALTHGAAVCLWSSCTNCRAAVCGAAAPTVELRCVCGAAAPTVELQCVEQLHRLSSCTVSVEQLLMEFSFTKMSSTTVMHGSAHPI